MEILSQFEFNGEVFQVVRLAEDKPAPEPEIIYLEDGYSKEMKYGMCVRSQAFDAFLDELMQGDAYEKGVAANAPRWFCLYLPSRQYDDAAYDLLKANYMDNYSFSMSNQMIMGGFRTDPEADTLSNFRTPVRYFDRKSVYKYFLDGVKSWVNNRIAYDRQRGNPSTINFPDGPK